MAMDATLQVRMDGQVKARVEELYRNLGTSFAEAVRVFAQQSLLEGGMPFQPRLKTWEEYTEEELDQMLAESEAAIAEGRVCTLEDWDRMMDEKLRYG